jgi:Ca2+-binding EF-hand superfamily protein
MNFGPPKPMSEIMFNKFDKDRSGKIDSKEFQQLCFSLGYPLTDVELSLAVKQLDKDGSNHIELNEFSSWWKISNRWDELKLDSAELEKRKIAADTFNKYDNDKSGFIEGADLDNLYNDLAAQKVTTKDKATFLADLDHSGDKRVNFAEYVEHLRRTGSITVKLPSQ